MICTFVAFVLSSLVTFTATHPQCLDFRPPFEVGNVEVSSSLFCDEYIEFGCCSEDKHSKLASKYEETLKKLKRNGLSQCADFVKSIICQECSPYAAHIYDSEVTKNQKPFPGLCTSYCYSFYKLCSEAVPFLTSSADIIDSLSSQNSFCKEIALNDVDYCYPELLSNDILNGNITREARTEKGCLCLERIDSGLRNPLALISPPDDSGRLFVAEQIGYVYIYYKDKTREKKPFLDLTDSVETSNRKGDERGFLGMRFHPNFVQNRKFYVFYSIHIKGDNKDKIRVSEFLVSVNNPNKAQASSERVILEVQQPWSNHNGGEILFGIDGYLYLFLGDGGAGGDPGNRAQDKSTLLGKVLRLDVDSPADPGLAYHIPEDNPFVGEEDAEPEIYAYGIRNIWRCDVDEGDPITGANRGRIICGDVGQGDFEEVDIIEKGGNYGWKAREGYECYAKEYCNKIGPEVLPIHAYDHSVGKSITGGHVYRGCMNPNLNGKYIFGDYSNGKIFTLTEKKKKKGTWISKEIYMCGADICFNDFTNDYENKILSFGEDDDGEVYMLSTDSASTEHDGGSFFRIVDPWTRGDPTQCRSYNKTYTRPVYEEEDTSPRGSTSRATVPYGNTDMTGTTKEEGMTVADHSSGGVTVTSAAISVFSVYGWQFNWMPVTTCIMVPAWKCYHYFL